MRTSVGALMGFAHLPDERQTISAHDAYKRKTIFISNEHFDRSLLECTVQYPMQMQHIKHPPIVNIELQKLIISLFHQFLSYTLPFGNSVGNLDFILEEKQHQRSFNWID